MIEWNVEPELFNLGILSIRYYSLAFIVGFLVGERYIRQYMLNKGYSIKEIQKLFNYVLIGTIVGARLGHCFFYEPMYYLSSPIEILKVWKGGLASHGGVIGILISIYIFNKKIKRINYLWLLDLISVPAIFTGGLIRLGNLMNSEIIGRPTNVEWSFIFTKVDNMPRHPTQIYEAIGFLIISIIVCCLYKKFNKKWISGRFIGLVLSLGMSWRIFIEFFKENQVAFESGMMLNMGQVLSIPVVIVGIVLIFREKIFIKK